MVSFVVLAFAFSVVAVVSADITTTTVNSGDCVCATTNVNARSRAGLWGAVRLTLSSGQCATASGASRRANGYKWYQVTYMGQTLWVAGLYLSHASSSSCSAAPSGGSCGSTVRQLACNLLNNPNLILATAHSSGRTDNAFARNNLRDTCDGREATRSRYSCPECRDGAPGGSVCISESVLRYLAVLVSGGRVKVNEIVGACHGCDSKHYSGLAIDLDDGPRDQEFKTTCDNRGGTGLNERTHIHCQFNS